MQENNNLLICGAGGFGHVVKEIAEASGIYDRISFLDDYSPIAIGRLADLENFRREYTNAVVAVGKGDLRERIFLRLKDAGYALPPIVSPKAYVSPTANLGEGVVVEPLAAINTEVEIGEGTFICVGTIVDHNSKVGRYSTLQSGCVVAANSIVSEKTLVDYNKVYADRTEA